MYSSAETHIFLNVLKPARILPPIHVEYYRVSTQRDGGTHLSFWWSIDLELEVLDGELFDLAQEPVAETWGRELIAPVIAATHQCTVSSHQRGQCC